MQHDHLSLFNHWLRGRDMSAPDANGWMPIETAPEGNCVMWVADGGDRGKGCAEFGVVYVYPDHRSYRARGFHGDWQITHWQPLPKPPVVQP